MRWEWFISWRYFTAKRKERFISLISLISILGIAVGVMALIVVTSVMNGFDKELREKFTSVNPHIIIEKDGGINNLEQLLPVIKSTPGVTGAGAFINSQALIKTGRLVRGTILRGIDPQAEPSVSRIGQYMIAGSLDLGESDIVIGQELAGEFYLNLGDKLTIISPEKGKEFDFNVAGIFNSGMYEYDLNLVLMSIPAAQKVLNLNGVVTGVGVRVQSLYQAREARDYLQQALGYPYWVRDWMSMNRNLLSALKLEKLTMFVIVALIVVVACFNIVASLIMLVMEKTKDIGILKAIGATNKAIKRIFTIEGLIIGVSGTFLGGSLGVGLCYLLKKYNFISLPRDIYYLDGLPVEMRWMDSLAIISCALIVSLLAAIYPARQAARLTPAETLRYE